MRWLVTAKFGESEYVSHRFNTYYEAVQAFVDYDNHGWYANIVDLA